jgi:hypothetical protein
MTGTIVFGPSVAETSWAAARDMVREDLWRRTTSALPDDQVDRGLHTALLELESERRWLWLENLQGALEMGVDAETVALPASVKSVSSIAYLSGTTGYDILIQKPLPMVRQVARGSQNGFPTFYAISNQQLYFDCSVAQGGQFELIFKSACPRYIEQAIATPPITLTLQGPAVIARACAHIALTYLKNEEEAARQQAAYDRILDRLFNEEDEARTDSAGGGCIQPDDSLHRAAFGE